MNTRREQVQAHRFVTRRIVSAMLSGDPETNDLPMRRLGQALFASVMIGAIVLAVVGVIGFIGGGTGKLGPKTLVVEKETGAKFVYDPDGDGTDLLYPVANYTSARLILGEASPAQRSMSHKALENIPRGPQLGIPNAPDALPAPSALLGLPWSVCDLPGAPGGKPVSRAVIGVRTPEAERTGPDQAILVSSSAGGFLIYHNRRLLIAETAYSVALGFKTVPRLVSDQFLNAVPAGAPLALPIPDAGAAAEPRPGGESATVGQVFKDDNNQYYLMSQENLFRIGAVYAKVRLAQLADETGSTVTPTPIQIGEAARLLNKDGAYFEPADYPRDMPNLVEAATAPIVCAQYDETDNTGDVAVLIFRSRAPAALVDAAAQVRQGDGAIVSSVDAAYIPGGRGVLVQPAPSLGGANTGSTIYLVTDSGVKFPLDRGGEGSADALAALGYTGVTPLRVPIDMLDLLPTGVTLDATTARQPIDGLNVATPSPAS